MQGKIAGRNATSDKDHVIGVDLRAFVALKRMVGQTFQKVVMDHSAEKQGMNVFYNQVSKIFEVLTKSATLKNLGILFIMGNFIIWEFSKLDDSDWLVRGCNGKRGWQKSKQTGVHRR